ncbi:MAG: CHAT domain-containing protein [Spirulina sp. SIO3F2]|nr:CHAT domain-containing protein [Spirulina sp. SIO3F2]
MRRFWQYVCLGLLITLVLGWPVGASLKPAPIKPTPTMAFSGLTFAQLSDTAQQRYEAGQYEAALELLLAAQHQAERSGDRLGVILALRNLALIRTRLGQWAAAEADLAAATDQVPQLPQDQQAEQQAAIAELYGQWHFRQGQDEAALKQWQAAAAQYTALDDLLGTTRNQLNQARALRYLGLYYQAAKQLTTLQTSLQQEPDSFLKAQALQQLGEVQRVTGKLQAAQATLTESAAIAAALNQPALQSRVLLALGHTAQTCGPDCPELQGAMDYYQQAEQLASTPTLKLTAQLNQLNALVRDGSAEAIAPARQLWQQLNQALSHQPRDRQTLNQQVQLAQAAIRQPRLQTPEAIATLLAQTVQAAEQLGDLRLQAFALKALGQLYEDHQRWSEAQVATQKSLQLAQAIQAPDLAYQDQWQLGRLFRAQQQREPALTAYGQAIATLGSIRGDLVAMSSDVQFSFKERVEPVYRQYVDLLLQPDASQDQLQQARSAIEALQLAELDNFFRDACLNAQERKIDEIDPQSAILYTIILDNRLEVVSALPGQPLTHHAVHKPKAEIEATLLEYRKYVVSPRRRPFNRKRLRLANDVYRWLVEPLESQLQQADTATLVFVLDGYLRNIPLPALHDGEQYLIEKYALALAPSLNLVDPQPLATQNLSLLFGGLTAARQGFNPLPNVELELTQIQATDANTSVLLNPEFTEAQVETMVNEEAIPVVHLATHGKFSSKAEETFVLTWDAKLDINELNALLRTDAKQTTPIELLVLSACQTATGDERAALGLAGVAVRAGARSTLASLWFVDDKATAELMASFYDALTSNSIQKAEALRQAQLNILQRPDKFQHPYYWSAFVLVGNWL